MTTRTTGTVSRGRGPAGGELASLDRGLQILAFIQDRGQVEVAEVIDGLGIPSSSAYRYVRLLKNTGFVAEIGGQLLPSERLADRSLGRSDHLLDVARPVLSWLRKRSGLNVALTVRVHTAALCLDTRRSGAGTVAFHPGHILELYAGASATPLLAMAPAAVQRKVLHGRIHRFTAATPDATTLRQQLAIIQQQGHHMSRGWLTPGMTAVGVPVFVAGSCLCALSLVGQDGDLTDAADALGLLRPAVDQLAARLSRGVPLAWIPPGPLAEEREPDDR